MIHKITYLCHFAIFMIFTAVLAFTLPGAADELHSDGLTAKDIIKQMADAYAKSKSYSDSGVVRIILINDDGRHTVEKSFKTAFVRHDRFRFEFREKNQHTGEHRFIIYREGKDVKTYWDLDKDLKLESLDRAVAAATGISGESAITVPAMLYPDEITWRRAIRFRDPKRIADDMIDKVNCFRIHDLIFGSPTTFWIEQKTFLLRKIYREQEFEDFQTQITTTYTPVLGGKVMDHILEFDPPKRN